MSTRGGHRISFAYSVDLPAVTFRWLRPMSRFASRPAAAAVRSEPLPLRVFVDGSIMKPQLGGIATYASELTNALIRRPDVEVCVTTSTAVGLDLNSPLTVIKLSAAVRSFGRASGVA